jgi:hypothetical protein
MGKFDVADELLKGHQRAPTTLDTPVVGRFDIANEFLGISDNKSDRIEVQRNYMPAPNNEIDVRTGKPRLVPSITGQESAGMGTLIKTGFVDDPNTKIEIFARARGISPDRYRTHQGEIIYQDDNGAWHPETQKLGADVFKRLIGENVPSLLPAVGGGLGAVAGPIGAGAGSALGELVRKSIGGLVFDEPQTLMDYLVDLGVEATLGVGGEVAGRLVVGGVNAAKMRGGGALKYGIKNELKDGLLSPTDHTRAEFVSQLAKNHGITLAPHQLYDKEGMTNIWKYLRKHPQTSDAVRTFEDAMAGNVETAMETGIGRISSAQDPAITGSRLVDTAGEIVEDASRKRTAAVKPLYDKAFAETNTIDTAPLALELKRNKSSIKKLQDIKPKPDMDTMMDELEARRVPVMKMTQESGKAYTERIASDYKRIIKKDVPTVGGDVDTKRISELQKRNADLQLALSGKPPKGFKMPTKSVGVDVRPVVEQIDGLLSDLPMQGESGGATEKALKKIRKFFIGEDGVETRLKSLDTAKKEIDAILDGPEGASIHKDMKFKLSQIKDTLTGQMDAVSPGYKKARAKFETLSPAVEKVEKGIIGRLSRVKTDKQMSKVANELFGAQSTTPEITKRARTMIRARDPELWNDAIGGHLRTVYEDLKTTQGGNIVNVAGKMHQKLFGTKKQRAILKAAMDPTQFKNLEDLMLVFKHAAIGTGSESMTAPFQAINEQLQKSAGSAVLRMADAPIRTLKEATFGKWNDIVLAGNQKKLLDALMDNQATKTISEMKALTPGSAKLIQQLGAFMGVLSGESLAVKPVQRGRLKNVPYSGRLRKAQ